MRLQQSAERDFSLSPANVPYDKTRRDKTRQPYNSVVLHDRCFGLALVEVLYGVFTIHGIFLKSCHNARSMLRLGTIIVDLPYRDFTRHGKSLRLSLGLDFLVTSKWHTTTC